MKKNKWPSFFWKILWFIGLVILSMISFNYENHIQQIGRDTFNFIPYIWTKFFISIIFGLYISIVLVRKWIIKVNFSLLWCVAIPCFLVSLAFPLLSTMASKGDLLEKIANTIYSHWLMQINSSNIFGMIAGLTLVISFFNSKDR